MEKHVITNLRNVNVFMSEEMLKELGWREMGGEICVPGLDLTAIGTYNGKINEYDEKIKECHEKIKEYERLIVHLSRLRGFAHLEQGKPTEAYSDFRHVTNSGCLEWHEALFFIGLANLKHGNIDEAIEDFNEYIEHNKISSDFVYWVGMGYYLLNDFNTAKKYFDSAIKQDPDFEEAYFIRGKVCIKSGKWEEAKKDFFMVLELNPENAEAQDFIRLVEDIQEKFQKVFTNLDGEDEV
jgi:tetratricopeptide (TPR) repeat protein